MDCCSNLSRYCEENHAVRVHQLGKMHQVNDGGIAFGPSSGDWRTNNLLLGDPAMRRLAGIAPLDRGQSNLMTHGPKAPVPAPAKKRKSKSKRKSKH